MSQTSNWQNIIWREWRNTEDEEYARQLFELVADEPVGWKSSTLLFLLGVLSGAIGGLILGIITIFRNMWIESLYGEASQTLFFFIAGGSLIGGEAGLLAHFLLRKRFAWPNLFFRVRMGLIAGFIFWLLGGPVIGIISGLIAATLGVSVIIWRGLKTAEPLALIVFAWLLTVLIVGIVTILIFGISAGWAIVAIIGPILFFFVFALMLHPDVRTQVKTLLDESHRSVSKYTGRHVTLIEQLLSYEYRNLYVWWRKQPVMAETEMALREAYDAKPEAKKIWTKPLRRLESQGEEPISLDKHIGNLRSDYWVARFVAHYALVALGGEAVLPLQKIIDAKDPSVYDTAIRLLANVEIETSSHLAEQAPNLLCPQCLVHCHAHKVSLSQLSSITYYGCRACHQSRKFLNCPEGIIAVLDAAWTETQNQQNGLLRVNWLTRHSLFDFDRVEIIQATDEEVERFAVQVGNDTDAVRKPSYKKMSCLVAPDCRMSENT